MKIHLGARNTLPRLPGALINVWLLRGGALWGVYGEFRARSLPAGLSVFHLMNPQE